MSAWFSAAFLALLATLSLGVEEPKPGIRLAHNATFLTYLHEEKLLGFHLIENLDQIHLPDVTGHFNANFWSKVNYTITKTRLASFPTPDLEVYIEDKMVMMEIYVPEINLEFDCILTWFNGEWEQYEVRGNATLTLVETLIKMEREIMIAEDNKEIVRYHSKNFSYEIRDVDLKLDDPKADDLIVRAELKEVKKLAEDLVSLALINLTKLHINFHHNATNDMYWDMTLLKTPTVMESWVEYDFRGEMRYKDDIGNDYTEWPEVIPPCESTLMVVYDVSPFALESVGKVIHKKGLFNYSYTKEDLPKDLKNLLDTKCENGKDCIGNLFPEVANKYPDSSVELHISTTQEPLIKIDKDDVFELDLWFEFVVNAVKDSDKSNTHLLTFNLHFASDIIIVGRKNMIVFDVQYPKNREFKVIKSEIGDDLPDDKLATIVSQALEKNVLPLINSFDRDGVIITSPDSLEIVNEKWFSSKEHLCICLEYERDFEVFL